MQVTHGHVDLPPDAIEAIKRNFEELDIDGENILDRKTVAEILGSEGSQLECLMVILLFERYDRNKDGYIDLDEFITFCADMNGLTPEEILKQIFEEADQNKNGYLDRKEVKRIGSLMGIDVTFRDSDATINVLDQDNDHQISFNEFLAIIQD